MLVVGCQPFNGGDVVVEDRAQGQDTGTRWAAIYMDRAGAALGDAAAIFCSGEAEAIAQDPQQRCPRLNVDLIRFAIHAQGNHGSTSFHTGFFVPQDTPLSMDCLAADILLTKTFRGA
jgi:hypothetical protein